MKRGNSPMDVPGVVRSSRDVAGGRRLTLDLEGEREAVPAILLLPNSASTRARAPAALLLHGYTSRKERMAEGIGRSLLTRGVASLAIDLPFHGERKGSLDQLSFRNPLQLVGAWRLALNEIRLALDYLSDLPAVDAQSLAIVGYSLGSFLSVVAAANDALVRVVVLASGGYLPAETPFASIVRAAADPLRAVRKLAGRPLLMVNGRLDRTIKPTQAERLFAAAGEPKEIRWYGGGHWPPPSEVDFAADWLGARVRRGGSAERRA